jgi:hypothetical protein
VKICPSTNVLLRVALSLLALTASCEVSEAVQDGAVRALPAVSDVIAAAQCPAGEVACGADYCMPSNSVCCAGSPGRYCPPGGYGCSNDGQFCTEPCPAASAPFSTGCATGGITCTTSVATGCCYNEVCCGPKTASPGCAASDACVAVSTFTACAFGSSERATPSTGGSGGGGGGGSGSARRSEGCSVGGAGALPWLLGLVIALARQRVRRRGGDARA